MFDCNSVVEYVRYANLVTGMLGGVILGVGMSLLYYWFIVR